MMKKRMIETQKALLSMLLVSVLILGGCRKEQSSNPATTTETTTIEQSSILSSENKSTQESEVESLEGKTSEGTKEESSKSSSEESSKSSSEESVESSSGESLAVEASSELESSSEESSKTSSEISKSEASSATSTKPAKTKPAETKPAETKPVAEKPVEKPVTPTKPTTPTKPVTPTKPTNPTLAKPNVDETSEKSLVSLVYAQAKPLDHCKQIPDTSYVSATATFSDGSKQQATVVSIYLSTIKGDAHTYSVKASLDGSEHSGVVTLQREPFNEEAYKGILTLSTNKKAANGKRKLTGADMDAYSKLFWSVQEAHNHLPFTHDVDYYFKDGANITTNEDDYTLEEIYEIAYAGLQRMRVHQNVPAFKSMHPVLMKQAQDHANTIAALPNYCNVTIMGQGAKFHTNHYYSNEIQDALWMEQLDAGLGGYWTEMLSPESNVFGLYLTCERGIQDHCPLSTRSDMTDIGIGITKITHNTFDKNSPTDHLMVIQVSGRDN